MVHHITLSEGVFVRLTKLAKPFVDREPEDVIRRLLDQNDRATGEAKVKLDDRRPSPERGRSADSRAPRERGAVVQIGDDKIDAVSVRALYEEALKLLVRKYGSKLQSVVPLKTSARRYLISAKPIHPTGKPFVIPVEFRGFCMEAHKDYKNAIAHLRTLCNRLGLNLQYLG